MAKPKPDGPLTNGEKMIFAAVLAAEFQKQMAKPRPRETIGFSEDARTEWARWEAGNVDFAIETAASAVEYMRDAVKRAVETHDDDVTAMLKSMLA